jgi:adenine/guanine/hypoxanthine permease
MTRLTWWTTGRGDIDATVAQVGFNLAQMVIPVFLLAPAGIPVEFSINHLLPGYALGFLIGSLGMCLLAVRLRRREDRADVTAHVYGNNVPAIIAYTLSIMLPVYLRTHDPVEAWRLGSAAVVWTGLIKLAAAPFAGLIQRSIPHAASMTVFGTAMYSYLALILLQRVFDDPTVGLVALAIIMISVAGVPFTRLRIPPFVVAWLFPLALALGIGYVHAGWPGLHFEVPWVGSTAPLQSFIAAIPYLSVILPVAIYHVLQDIASVTGASAAGDEYDARSVLCWDGLGTLACGLAGSAVAPVVYALHPPYKHLGARTGFSVWTPIIFLIIVVSGLAFFFAQLFPWAILSAIIAYITVGVGTTTLRRVDTKYTPAVLLGFVLPAGAVVSASITAALPALGLSAANPAVETALNRSIYWTSVQALGNGFLFLVLVVSAVITELINRNFDRAGAWCAIASAFSWFGLMHSPVMRWAAQPRYAAGWLCGALLVYSGRWWSGESSGTQRQTAASLKSRAG